MTPLFIYHQVMFSTDRSHVAGISRCNTTISIGQQSGRLILWLPSRCHQGVDNIERDMPASHECWRKSPLRAYLLHRAFALKEGCGVMRLSIWQCIPSNILQDRYPYYRHWWLRTTAIMDVQQWIKDETVIRSHEERTAGIEIERLLSICMETHPHPHPHPHPQECMTRRTFVRLRITREIYLNVARLIS